MVALSVILFPPLLIAFLLVMERVEEPLRRPAVPARGRRVPRAPPPPARSTPSPPPASAGRCSAGAAVARTAAATTNPPLV